MASVTSMRDFASEAVASLRDPFAKAAKEGAGASCELFIDYRGFAI